MNEDQEEWGDRSWALGEIKRAKQEGRPCFGLGSWFAKPRDQELFGSLGSRGQPARRLAWL